MGDEGYLQWSEKSQGFLFYSFEKFKFDIFITMKGNICVKYINSNSFQPGQDSKFWNIITNTEEKE